MFGDEIKNNWQPGVEMVKPRIRLTPIKPTWREWVRVALVVGAVIIAVLLSEVEK